MDALQRTTEDNPRLSPSNSRICLELSYDAFQPADIHVISPSAINVKSATPWLADIWAQNSRIRIRNTHHLARYQATTKSQQWRLSMDGPRKDAFQFVQISHPQDAASWKRQVRSHAAKNSRARQQRVVLYQEGKVNETQGLRAKEALGRSEHFQQSMKRATGPIKTALGGARIDPFNSFVRKVTKFESFLLDHCMLYLPPNIPVTESYSSRFIKISLTPHSRKAGSATCCHLLPFKLSSGRSRIPSGHGNALGPYGFNRRRHAGHSLHYFLSKPSQLSARRVLFYCCITV